MKISSKLTTILTMLSAILISCSSGSGGGGGGGTSGSVTYTAFSCPGTNNVAFPGVSGIRGVENSESEVYITGVYVQYGANHAFLYRGPVLGGGTCSKFNYPSSPGITVTSTSLYGPDNNGSNNVIAVGSYTTLETGPIAQLGLLYIGAPDGSTMSTPSVCISSSGCQVHYGYNTLNPSSLTSDTVINTLAHSTMGGIVVGNYDTDAVTGRAFIYNISNNEYYSLDKPGGSASITAYGIWYNGGTSYTIAGGFSDVDEIGVNTGFITDWDSSTQKVYNFTTLNYNNLPGSVVGTHFEGITSDGGNGYNLAADWEYLADQGKTSPAFAHITRNPDGTFNVDQMQWTSFDYYPGSSWTSANTVYKNHILGLYQAGEPVADFGYVATINESGN